MTRWAWKACQECLPQTGTLFLDNNSLFDVKVFLDGRTRAVVAIVMVGVRRDGRKSWRQPIDFCIGDIDINFIDNNVILRLSEMGGNK